MTRRLGHYKPQLMLTGRTTRRLYRANPRSFAQDVVLKSLEGGFFKAGTPVSRVLGSFSFRPLSTTKLSEKEVPMSQLDRKSA